MISYRSLIDAHLVGARSVPGRWRRWRLAGSLGCVLAGGLIAPGSAGADGASGLIATGSAGAGGAVYAMTNALGDNEVVAYQRASDGTLTLMQLIATGGGGSGVQLDPTDSLGSQGGLVLDKRNGRLFAVNTESLAPDGGSSDPGFPNTEDGDCQTGSISSFTILRDGRLKFDDRVPSGGLFPTSLTVNGGLLYVLNAGGPGVNPVCGIGPNITGFNVGSNGQMTPLDDSVQPIDPGTSPGSFLNCDPGGGPFPTAEFQCGLNPPAFPRSPAQVGFSPNGDKLVVTVKGTNTLYVFPVGRDGTPEEPTVTQVGTTTQPTPFGFAFTETGGLIVTEPFGTSATIPNPTAGAVSSYQIGSDGSLQAISSHVANGHGTTCWIAIAQGGTYAYVSNNLSSNISTYKIGADGSLTLLQSIAGSANGPNDFATVADGKSRFLYALASRAGAVAGFRINGDGSLTSIGSAGGLPVAGGAQGLAGY